MLKQEYAAKSLTIVRGLFREEVPALDQECQRLQREGDLAHDNLRALQWDKVGGGKQFDRLDPVTDISPALQRLALSPRLLELVEEILGEPATLFKDKLIFKTDGVRGYNNHQDYFNWQGSGAPPREVVSVAVAIDASTAGNGAVVYYPGPWDRLLNEGEEVSDIYNPHRGVVDPKHLEGIEPFMPELEPGDVILFSSLIPHESGPNHSGNTRRILY
ncbi:MAG: hypothetical protein OHK0021_25000 [Bryobacter sp.]